MSDLVTLEQLKKVLPSRKNVLTDEVVDIINKCASEPEFQGESLLQTMITYESVMVKHKAGVKDYINAIRFCAYLIAQNDNYTEAYKRTFAERDFVKERMNAPSNTPAYNELTSAASRYRKNKLVIDILTLSQVPLDLIFAGVRYKAIGVLAHLMENAKLDRDKVAAADKLLTHTAPKDIKIELDVGVKENSATQNLMEQLAIMAAKQKAMLEAGVHTLNDFGAMKPKNESIDAEYEEVK